MKEKSKAIANIIIALVLFINSLLTAAGKSPIPIDEDSVAVTISSLIAAADIVFVWWKNQNVTPEAQTAQKIADQLKADRNEIGGETDPLGDERGKDNEWE